MYSFPIWNQSVVPCPVLTVASWPAHRFLRRQVRWSDILISWRILQFVVIHTVKGSGVVNKAEIDIFLELSCFLYDPVDVGSLISGSSAFSKLPWTSESSQFIYFWSLAWKNLCITLLSCEMSAIVWWFEHSLEKEMATHSSILAWRIPWTEELGGLQSTGHRESDMTERLHFHFHFW